MPSSTTDVRSLRLARGLTQQELAFRAGCSIAMIGLLDRGMPSGNSRVARRVLEVLTSPVFTSEAAPAGGSATTREDDARHGSA